MLDENLTSIKITKIIHAKKWKVIRLLTRVWEFPSYISCVKEASVIQKDHHVLRTKWRIEINNIPINWVEEDNLKLRQNAIYFKAIEGDMEEFKGEWLFRDHPEGTEVTVNVHLKVAIPISKDFTEAYIKKLLTLNFESILDGLERRLVSIRYASYRQGDTEKIAGFGVIGHLYNFHHLEKCLKMLKPDFKMPSREFMEQLFHITPSFKLYDVLNFKSKTGQVVNGCFIVATFIPEMVEKDVWAVFSKVVRACKLAEKYGVGIVTLGGFTSIVGERIGQEMSNQVDVPVTTGNTFTAAMTIDGVIKAAALFNKDISQAKMAIVGGTGDIGSACARVLAGRVKQLIITGRTKSNLYSLKQELTKKHKIKVITTTDNKAALKDADIVIAAASVASSVLKIEWFKSGAIICDVGYPKNIAHNFTDRNDIFIFSGGLANSPMPIELPIDVGLPRPEVIYGCFAEAIILALEKRYENFSFGRGQITPEKIDEIRRLGEKHGFEVSDFYWGDKLINEPSPENVKKEVAGV